MRVRVTCSPEHTATVLDRIRPYRDTSTPSEVHVARPTVIEFDTADLDGLRDELEFAPAGTSVEAVDPLG